MRAELPREQAGHQIGARPVMPLDLPRHLAAVRAATLLHHLTAKNSRSPLGLQGRPSCVDAPTPRCAPSPTGRPPPPPLEDRWAKPKSHCATRAKYEDSCSDATALRPQPETAKARFQ